MVTIRATGQCSTLEALVHPVVAGGITLWCAPPASATPATSVAHVAHYTLPHPRLLGEALLVGDSEPGGRTLMAVSSFLVNVLATRDSRASLQP